MNTLFLRFLKEMQKKGRLSYFVGYSLKNVTTFGTGGKAGYFIQPFTEEALIDVLLKSEECGIAYIVIGNGSNLLFDDKGYSGAVISTVKLCAIFSFDEDENSEKRYIFTMCGAKLPLLSMKAMGLGLSGFEGLCSIPATVGGAISLNAGAFGSQISDTLESIRVFSLSEKRVVLKSKCECGFAYRESKAAKDDECILSACFLCKKDEVENIRAKMLIYKKKRAGTQPIGQMCGGCYFRTPSESFDKSSAYYGISAGRLIDECGLKGLSVGSATVSKIHANFLINTSDGDGRTSDVIRLADIVKATVYKQTGIELTEEVRYVAYKG